VTNNLTLVNILKARSAKQPNEVLFTYMKDVDHIEATLTYSQLDQRAKEIAAHLQLNYSKGDRALLLYPPGLDFIIAFMGCMYAGIIPVPAYPPRQRHHLIRLEPIVKDSDSSIILSTTKVLSRIESLMHKDPELKLDDLQWIATDTYQFTSEKGYMPIDISKDSLAFLQYTSGSTGNPKGVMVSHENLINNLEMVQDNFFTSEDVIVSWLPSFHDMGLIATILFPIYIGCKTYLISHILFTQDPLQWLKMISKYKGTFSGAPNFAYDLCVNKITEEEKATLDLSSWKRAFNGAEPLHPHTIEKFSKAFSTSGFNTEIFEPAYGLAEATLIVSAGEGKNLSIHSSKLQQHIVEKIPSNSEQAITVVSSGTPAMETTIKIVDPQSKNECLPGQVGEIWVSSPSVAMGYWNREKETKQTFHANINGSSNRKYLRTGDLGFMDNNHLFVTGRIKDLIIIRGRNLYPQDIELTVEESHPALIPTCGATFSVENQGEEQLVIVHEIQRHTKDLEEAVHAIRRSVTNKFDVPVHHVVLVKRASIPKTTSGKIKRGQAKTDFLHGDLKVVYEWTIPKEVLQTTADNSKQETFLNSKDIESWLIRKVAEESYLPIEEIDTNKPFTYYGLDSTQSVQLAGELEKWLQRSIPTTILWDSPTISALAKSLSDLDTISATNEFKASKQEPIAVIGVSCRFPKANNPLEFWELLRSKTDAISTVPKTRWNVDDFYDADPSVPGKTSSRWGGFIEDIDKFDPDFFGILPREATSIDPQQRLLLELAKEALDDAGQPEEKLIGSRTGVFIGISSSEYAKLLYQNPELIDIYSGTGGALSIAANRISYGFDFRGPSMAVDTACSSSLVSLHLACNSLQNGESSIALAGGVNLIINPDLSINFSKMGAMAPDGRCKTFDSRADGYVRGEGAGLVVLKPLSKALEDNDRIYSIIRGSAINQDGLSNGITAPNRYSQEEVLREAYQNAQVSPGKIQYIETHGTGTPLGDPIEASALNSVLSEGRDENYPVAIGSVKTNIGHLEAGAGIAGFIKVVLSLWNKHLPASLHYKSPNPHIPFESLPLYVQTELTAWPDMPGQKALAGVSSFGFGGTNAHMVLEEAPDHSTKYQDQEIIYEKVTKSNDNYILPISAKTIDSLNASVKDYMNFLESEDNKNLKNICYTAALRRDHYQKRIAFTGNSINNLLDKMHNYNEFPIRFTMDDEKKLAFVFSGHGSYWIKMGKDLLENPAFRKTILEFEQVLKDLQIEWSLTDQLSDENHSLIKDDADIQILVFAVQIAIASLWKSWGIQSKAVVGHSMGEISAAYIAGMLNLEDAIKLLYYRSRSLRKLSGNGKMAAIAISENDLQEYLADYQDRIYIAAVNSPQLTIVSGEVKALKELIKSLKKNKIAARFMRSNTAGHCPLVDAVCPEFEKEIKDIKFHSPTIPFYSTVTGKQITSALDATYWVNNLRETVQFSKAVQSMINNQIKNFLEVSPDPILSSAIRHTLEDNKVEGNVLASLHRDKPGHQCMLSSLGDLYSLGFDPNWMSVYPNEKLVSLPTYHWNKQRYWIIDQNQQETKKTYIDKKTQRTPQPISSKDQLLEQLKSTNSEEGVQLLENQLRKLVSKVLRLPIASVPPNKPLISLGLDSLIAIELKNLLVNKLGINIDISSLLKSKSISELAEETSDTMEAAVTTKTDLVSQSLVTNAESKHEAFLLNDMQHAYWLGRSGIIELGDVSGGIYLEFESNPLHVDKLNKAWQRLIERHEMLRTVIHPNGQQQILNYIPSYQIKVEYLNDIEEKEALHHVENIRKEMSSDSLPNDQWPLFDIRVSFLPNQQMRIHFFFDGLITDATSLAILMTEWKQLYDDIETELPSLDISFRDYVLAEAEIKNTDNYQISKEYWMSRISELPAAPELPLRVSPDNLTNYTFKRRTKKMNKEKWEKLKAFSLEKEITPSMVLCTAYSEVLRTWSKNTNFTLNLTIHDRSPVHSQVTDMVGVFTNLILLEINYDSTNTFDLKAQQLQNQIREDMKHTNFNGVEVIREISRRNGNPIQQSMMPVVFTSILKDMEENWSWLGDLVEGIAETPQIWLDHVAYEVDGDVVLIWDAVEDLFPEGMLDDMFDSYFAFLISLADSTDNWTTLTPSLVPEKHIEQQILMHQDTLELKQELLHAPFITNAIMNPDHPAIITTERTLTYEEVYRRSNQLAFILKEKGAQPNQLVAIVMQKGWEQIIGTLGILFSGAAYLPIDPSLPNERIQYLLENGDVDIVITQPLINQKMDWPDNIEHIQLQDDFFRNLPDTPHEFKQQANDLAYVIFTSGTTGLPKGVMIDHKGALNTCLDINQKFNVSRSDRIFSLSALSFDLSVYDIFGSLSAGAAIVLPDASSTLDPQHWATLMQDEKVTIWNSAPALMNIYVEYTEDTSVLYTNTLRLVMLSGDWIPLNLPERIWNRNNDIQLISLGGATEASIWSIYYEINEVKPNWTAIPYGKSLANQQVYVLNENFEHCPYWVPGHIYIGGIGVAKGYWKDKEKTVQHMIKHPKTNERIYRTGDLGVYMPDGNIHILGREDNQVKINGYRIELGEIESTLSEHVNIKSAVVTVLGTSSKKHLLAYIVPRQSKMNEEQLDKYLSSKLPAYMVPANYNFIDEIPLTSNGKIDRKGLPEPAKYSESQSIEGPRNKTEEDIAQIWNKILGVDNLSIHDNFFELGGTSVQLIQIMGQLRKRGYSVETQILFEKQTIAELAEILNEKSVKKTINITQPEKTMDFKVLRSETNTLNKGYQNSENILLTGSTGYVGIYLLRDLITQTQATVYCLVRAKDSEKAKDRLLNQIEWYFPEADTTFWMKRIVPIAGDITHQLLGLDEEEYMQLCNQVETVIHSAAEISHFGDVDRFQKVNADGTEAMIVFSLTGRMKTLHFISTIGIYGNYLNFTESHLDVGQELHSPYSETKLCAEKSIHKAIEQGLNAVIYRLGFVGPDSQTGRFQRNIEDNAFYLSLRAIIHSGLAAYHPDTFVQLSPVDYISKAIVDILQLPEAYGQTFHLIDSTIQHYDFIRLLQAFGYSISVMNAEDYREQLLNWCEDEEEQREAAIIVANEDPDTTELYPVSNEWTLEWLDKYDIEFQPITTSILMKMIAYCIDIGFIKAPPNWGKLKNQYIDLLVLGRSSDHISSK
jgi:amino acid adenylation domain-containing protein/thioester reductase-like protein